MSNTLISRIPKRSASGRATKVKAEVSAPRAVAVIARAGEQAPACLKSVVVIGRARSAKGAESVSGRLAPAAKPFGCPEQSKVKDSKPSIFARPGRRISWAAELQQVKVFSAHIAIGDEPQDASLPSPLSVCVGTPVASLLVDDAWWEEQEKMAAERETFAAIFAQADIDLAAADAREQAYEEEMEALAASAFAVIVVPVAGVFPPSQSLACVATKAMASRYGSPPPLVRRSTVQPFDMAGIKPVPFSVDGL